MTYEEGLAKVNTLDFDILDVMLMETPTSRVQKRLSEKGYNLTETQIERAMCLLGNKVGAPFELEYAYPDDIPEAD